LALARPLAPKKDRDLLGQNEFEVQDRIHPIGIKAIQTTLAKRKKGYQSFSVICPACQELARFQRWQSKNFLLGFSQFGPWLSGAPSFWGALQK
jgi:hypothetical protein